MYIVIKVYYISKIYFAIFFSANVKINAFSLADFENILNEKNNCSIHANYV